MQTFSIDVSIPCEPGTGPWIETIHIQTMSRLDAQNIALEIVARRFDIPAIDLHVVTVS